MLAEIRLKQFRSYKDDSFEFTPGVNIIVGPNASGKTNLLESILTVSRGSSYRVKDYDLVQSGKTWGRLDARLTDGGERILKITREPVTSRVFEIDGKIFKRLTLGHTLPVVLFEPNHLQLLAGGPERRRTYLDDLLEQTVAGYGTLRRQFGRTLSQRNALLKNNHSNLSTQLFPWNVRLSQLAGQIVRARTELTRKIQAAAPDLYIHLSHSNVLVSFEYDMQCPVEAYETQLLKRLESSTEIDRQRGYTAHGPHREDLLVLVDNHPVQEVASRGESRTLVLALKIIELQLLETARSITPLLLLDDVFSELDGARRHALTDYLAPYQTFITTTDADLVLQHFAEECNVIPVQKS